MPTALKPTEELPLPKWQRPAKTTHNLSWANIKVIDLSTFDEPGAKQRLAEELREAVCMSLTNTSEACMTDTIATRFEPLDFSV